MPSKYYNSNIVNVKIKIGKKSKNSNQFRTFVINNLTYQVYYIPNHEFMKIKYFLALCFAALSGSFLSAQTEAPVLPRCGVGLEEGALIMERLFENRRKVSTEQIQQFRNSRAIKYIPLKLHIVGDNNGNGYVSIDNAMASLCDLNNDFASQDIQFYFKDITNSINYINNTGIYNNGASISSQSVMWSNKASNCLNIFISPSVQNQVASYYTGAYDFVFLLNQMANGSSSTSSHEVGHFFDLPHTFYGWEGTDVTQYGTGNVPASVGGAPTERFARSGACSNCATAGDGHCDTPADYMSDRANCPFSQGVKDACGVAIDPTESLIMSYYADICVDSFTPEQKNTMAADIIVRGWNSFPSPNPSNAVTGTGMTATYPTNGSAVPLSDITLTWGAVPGATAYIVTVDRTLFGTPVENIARTIVYGSNSYTIPQALLAQPRTYTWKVKPFNQLSYCGAYATFTFNTTLASGMETNFSESAELRILSNPVSSAAAEILVSLPQEMVAGIKLYSMDGKQVANIENVQLFAGDNVQLLDVSTLTAGIYMVVVSTEKGSLQQKLVINK